METLAKSQVNRLFSSDCDTSLSSNESEEEEVSDSTDFKCMLKKAVSETETVSKTKETEDISKNISKELSRFIDTNKRTEVLELLYQSLLTIAPTSVSCERVFSVSGFLINKRRSNLSNISVDNLTFLSWFFQHGKDLNL